jgi:cysteine-rich repeat protein
VLSSATDSNGTTPAYTWSVSPVGAGTFVTPTAQNTAFNCDLAGTALLTVTSTITTTDGTCDDTLTVSVSCANVTCGNGVPDPGEQCDGQPGCPADCTVSCGDNIVEYTETCEPPNSNTCNAVCQPRPALCGDNFLTPPELCDDGNLVNGDGCESTCVPTPAAACGDTVQSSGEECESPTVQVPFNGNATCSNDCQSVVSAACNTCEQGSPCVDLTLGCATFPTAAGRAACFNLAECIRDNPTCAAVSPEPCYCGALDTPTCGARPPFPDPNAPAGPCARQFEAAMETNVPTNVLVNFSNLAVPGAHAVQRVLCDEAFCPVCFTP